MSKFFTVYFSIYKKGFDITYVTYSVHLVQRVVQSIRRFMRLNTFGDEVFGDRKVLQSYYYGISHFIVGGRCKCNGHSNVCIPSNPDEPDSRMICLCKHGTTGDDCGSCLADHWDRPWKRATSEKPNPCKRKCCIFTMSCTKRNIN